MIRAAVALLVSLSLLGCFPHNPKARTYAKIGEGTAILAGIAISAFANTTADCDEMELPGVTETGCRSSAKWMSTAGVVLIVGGLLGFVATVSTAEDPPAPKTVELREEPAPTPARAQAPASVAPPPSDAGSAEPAADGSAAPEL